MPSITLSQSVSVLLYYYLMMTIISESIYLSHPKRPSKVLDIIIRKRQAEDFLVMAAVKGRLPLSISTIENLDKG